MARFCPVVKERVIYTFCQECEDKVCRRPGALKKREMKKNKEDKKGKK